MALSSSPGNRRAIRNVFMSQIAVLKSNVYSSYTTCACVSEWLVVKSTLNMHCSEPAKEIHAN